jgi:hypothetical protein
MGRLFIRVVTEPTTDAPTGDAHADARRKPNARGLSELEALKGLLQRYPSPTPLRHGFAAPLERTVSICEALALEPFMMNALMPDDSDTPLYQQARIAREKLTQEVDRIGSKDISLLVCPQNELVPTLFLVFMSTLPTRLLPFEPASVLDFSLHENGWLANFTGYTVSPRLP